MRSANDGIYEDVVVPFVVSANHTVQFGVVYLISHNFPNTCLLCGLLEPRDRVEIIRWLLGLVNDYLDRFPAPSKIDKKLPRIKSRMKLDNVIVKPVQTYSVGYSEINLTLARATSILQLYKNIMGQSKREGISLFPCGSFGLSR